MGLYTLFLFAHQDDEFGVFHTLSHIKRTGGPVRIAYLTTGNPDGMPNPRRNGESLKVLASLGVSPDEVEFVGESARIPDGRLVEHLDAASAALKALAMRYGRPRSLYTHAYEGGHQDHDAAYLVGVSLAESWGILNHSIQTPLYCKAGIPRPFFRMFHALKANGPRVTHPIPWKERVRFLGFYFSYRSQWKSWIGLWPFVLLHYLFRGTEVHQTLNLQRMDQRPHPGPLLYEQRGFYRFDQFVISAKSFIEKTRADSDALRELHTDSPWGSS